MSGFESKKMLSILLFCRKEGRIFSVWKERDKLGFCPFEYVIKIQLEDGEWLALTETAPKLSLLFDRTSRLFGGIFWRGSQKETVTANLENKFGQTSKIKAPTLNLPEFQLLQSFCCFRVKMARKPSATGFNVQNTKMKERRWYHVYTYRSHFL